MPSTISLSISELDLLVGNVSDEGIREILKRTRQAQLSAGQADRDASVDLERHELSTLLNELGNLLCEMGLGPDDEPNALGRVIEALIDRVNRRLRDTGPTCE